MCLNYLDVQSKYQDVTTGYKFTETLSQDRVEMSSIIKSSLAAPVSTSVSEGPKRPWNTLGASAEGVRDDGQGRL